MVLTFVALLSMKRAQPALIYLVPATLIPVILCALIRKEFSAIWHGRLVWDQASNSSNRSFLQPAKTPLDTSSTVEDPIVVN